MAHIALKESLADVINEDRLNDRFWNRQHSDDERTWFVKGNYHTTERFIPMSIAEIKLYLSRAAM